MVFLNVWAKVLGNKEELRMYFGSKARWDGAGR